MKRLTRYTAFWLLAITCPLPTWAKPQPSENQAKITVQVQSVKRLQVPDTLSALGTMQAVQTTDLSFSSAGHIDSILFKNGAHVKKGDVIASLDDAEVKTKLASLKANLEAAKLKYQRYQLLKDSGVFSKQDILDVNTAYKVAEANYASVLSSTHDLSLMAPFAGTLGEFKFSLGAYMNVGMPLVNLVQLNPLKVKYSFSQAVRQAVVLGQKIQVTTDALPNQVFNGKVTFISPTQDTQTGRFSVEAEINNPDDVLSPGFFVRVSQVINPGSPELLVPQSAIVADQNQSFVYVVNKGIAEKTLVTLGNNTNNGMVVIQQGVHDNQQVVINGTQKLDNETRVTILPNQPPSTPTPTTNQPDKDEKTPSKLALSPTLSPKKIPTVPDKHTTPSSVPAKVQPSPNDHR